MEKWGAPQIPPTAVTAVGGLFRSGLHASTHRVLESHPRKWVDSSDPASEPKRRTEFKSEFSSMGPLPRRTGWLDLNNPPTAVWGIHQRLLAADRLIKNST